jgi:hypothetical protein
VDQPLTGRDLGFLLGILVGEGTFGGDGRQAQITVRMHTRHERLFHHLVRIVPGSRLYGPYRHGERTYFQWMARGLVLQELVPVLAQHLDELDAYAADRFRQMCDRYRLPVIRPDTSAG